MEVRKYWYQICYSTNDLIVSLIHALCMTLEKVEAPRKMQSQQHACWASSINFNLQAVCIFPHILLLYRIASLLAKNLQRTFSNINPRFRDLGRHGLDSIAVSIFCWNIGWQILTIRGQDPNNSPDREKRCLVLLGFEALMIQMKSRRFAATRTP